MATPYSTYVISRSVIPTIMKFAYIATRLGIFATQVYRTVAGLTPPAGYSYGRYYESGDPLLQFATSATSVTDLINRGVTLRASLANALTDLVSTAATEDIGTYLEPAVYTAFAALISCSATPTDTIAAMSALAGNPGFLPPPIVVGGDEIGTEISSLAARTAALIRKAALINMAEATAQYTPASSNDAITLRNSVASLFDAELALLGSWFQDADYSALSTLRMAVVNDLNTRASVLNPLVQVNYTTNLPSLVIAYELYADASQADALTARNNPVDPGFMPLVVEALAP
jgi:prophage DNA circulation protein